MKGVTLNFSYRFRLAALVDSRIEPIPCGSRQWREDDVSAIVEIVRREEKIPQNIAETVINILDEDLRDTVVRFQEKYIPITFPAVSIF